MTTVEKIINRAIKDFRLGADDLRQVKEILRLDSKSYNLAHKIGYMSRPAAQAALFIHIMLDGQTIDQGEED